jgi:serine protease inhibitor ecotin
MQEVKRLALVMAVAALAAAAIAPSAQAQQLGRRKSASPQAESKVTRVVARAELQARSQDGSSLKSDDLRVSRSCGNVQIGGTASARDQSRPNSLVPSKTLRAENVTVTKDTVNICR